MNPVQEKLSREQHRAFFHDEFVQCQLAHFKRLCGPVAAREAVVDMGGGAGHFAAAAATELGLAVRVVDADPEAVEACRQRGLDAVIGDALDPQVRGDEAVVCFNLILHHLVASDERGTERLQSRALTSWRGSGARLFINEYIYDSWLDDASGRLIYLVTSSRFLSAVASVVARAVPSLRANTFGVGVRFRALHDWRRLLADQWLRELGYQRGPEEHVSWARRMLLIRSCRKDSFVLGFAPPAAGDIP